MLASRCVNNEFKGGFGSRGGPGPAALPDTDRTIEQRPSEVRELTQRSPRESTLRFKGGPSLSVSTETQKVFTTNDTHVATLALGDMFVEVRALDLTTLAAAALLQKAIDNELLRSGHTRLLVDARDMLIAPNDVNDYMWRWAHAHPLLNRIAVVNQSQVMSVAVRMRAVAKRQHLAAFQQYSEAVAWIRS